MYEFFGSWCTDELLDKACFTLLDLSVVYFGKVRMLYIFELVNLSKLTGKPIIVVNIVFFVVHEVLVGSLLGAINVCFAEKGVIKLVKKLNFVKQVVTNWRNAFTHLVYNI